MKVKVKSLSVRLFATLRTVAYQAPPSIGFSRQECWSGLPFPSPGDLPDPGLWHCRQMLYCLSHQGSEVKSLSHVRLFATPWTVAHQAPLSMGFYRQEYWNRLLCPTPGYLSYPGIKLSRVSYSSCIGRQVLYH